MRTFPHIFTVMIAALLLSCSGVGASRGDSVGIDSVPVDSVVDISDLTAEARHAADSVLSSMTLEQQVAQCFMPTIYARNDEPTLRKLEAYSRLGVGGVVLLKGDMVSAAVMADKLRGPGVPAFVAIDAEWGLGMRLEDAPGFPRNGHLSNDADELVLYDYGQEVARESRRLGINMVLGPVIDVTGRRDGIIGTRSFGDDPHRVADLGVAYARGLESGGVLSVAKHFPGHGSPADDSHRTLPVINRSLHQLDSIDLYPFRRYVDSGLSAVMVGHLAVPALDSKMIPAAVSDAVIGDLLRNDLGFKGLVITDALNMEGANGYDGADALQAGADLVIGPYDTKKEIDAVLDRVANGELDATRIADSCRRILFYKYILGLFGEQPVEFERLREDVRGNSDSLRDVLGRYS